MHFESAIASSAQCSGPKVATRVQRGLMELHYKLQFIEEGFFPSAMPTIQKDPARMALLEEPAQFMSHACILICGKFVYA